MKLFKRLGLVVALIGLTVLATASPAALLAPSGAVVEITAREAWTGHPACGAPVEISLTGDVGGVGGYETTLSFDSGYLAYTEGNLALTDFLSAGGTRFTAGQDGTPLLEAVTQGALKFGDYSWGTLAGADAPGLLATVTLDVLACGTSRLSLTDTQIVDYLGESLMLESQATDVPLRVNAMLNADGDDAPLVTGQDVLTVASALNTSVSCDDDYQHNANGDEIPVVTGQDVLAVANALNESVVCP